MQLRDVYTLTPFQHRILALRLDGCSIMEISAATGQMESSIQTRLSEIYRALGLPRYPSLRAIRRAAIVDPDTLRVSG